MLSRMRRRDSTRSNVGALRPFVFVVVRNRATHDQDAQKQEYASPPLNGKQSSSAVTFDQAVVEGDVCPAPRHQLSPHDSRVDGTRSLLCLFRAYSLSGYKRFLEPRNVDVGECLNFCSHYVG